MKKLRMVHTPPFITFLLKQIIRKDMNYIYEYDTLGGEIPFRP